MTTERVNASATFRHEVEDIRLKLDASLSEHIVASRVQPVDLELE